MPDIITPSAEAWDAFVLTQPRAHVLQLSAWGTLKAAYGWRVERVALAQDGAILAGAQILFRPLPLTIGTMAYVAMSPYISLEADVGTYYSASALISSNHSVRTQRAVSSHPPASSIEADLWRAIHASAKRNRAAFLKWEPGIYALDDSAPNFAALGFRASAQTVQPPRTVLIDLTGDDEAILARMNQGTRRKIRQSQKNDLHIYEAPRAGVVAFTSMMQTTGARNTFGVHQPDYYALAYELFVPQHAALILADHEGEPLAGVMVFAAGRQAWYLYGASSDSKRNLMASYGVQWAAIQWAKARGCTTYDMWGIPDEDEATLEAEFEQRSDGLWGVYGFKRGWGGSVVRSLGAWDYIYNPLIYTAYQTALRLRP
jgi:peptidoglycan pentaglycine glycine transferase (the first glycine)